MGQVGSTVACGSAEEERDYLLEMPQQTIVVAAHGQLMALLERERLESMEDLSLLLPDECLESVFHKLDPRDRMHCSLVCRRWYKLEGRSRTRLSLHARADLMPYLPRIFGRFSKLSTVILKCDRKEPSIDDRALILVGKHCKGLVKLKLKGCKDISDEGLDHFSRVSGGLKKFSCASCGFGPMGLNCLLQRCPELESLAIKRLRGLSQAFPELIGPGHGRIRKLCLKELRNAKLFGPLIVGSPNLQRMRLSKNIGQWDKVLEAIMQHVPSLQELHMERLQLSDRGLQAVAQCRALEALYIVKASEISNFGLSSIAFGCQGLKKLRLDGWRSGRIGDEGLISIAKRCRELQELVLIRISVGVGSLSLLGTNCSKLERMAICNCDSFGDVELSCVAARFRSLRKLCVRGCPISNLGVEGLAAGCPALTRLKIRNCAEVSLQGIGNLKLRLDRSLWVSLINDLPRDYEEEQNHQPLAEQQQQQQQLQQQQQQQQHQQQPILASNRIHRVVQGSSQLMRYKLSHGAAVSCYCAK